jgi:hypothetical protein
LNQLTRARRSTRSRDTEDKVVAIDSRKTPPSGSRLLYDRKEAARQLSISIRSLDYLIAAKAFQTRRMGRKVMIPHGELVRFASANHYDHLAMAS